MTTAIRTTRRKMTDARRFREASRVGEILAIDPQAVEFSYLFTGTVPNDLTEDGIAIVTVHGPLEHHETDFWDSYEAILRRVEQAMVGSEDMPAARAVVLKIDSPGGEAAGSSYAHRKIRRLRKKYGIPVFAYANETAASAAYAIACAADEIWLPDTGTVGSIGVIATMFDRTEQNKKSGLNIELITSGERKADGHADRVITDDIRERMQERVMDLAQVFWSIVADARGTDVKSIADLQAGVFTGQKAVDVGIADGVASWDAFLRIVSSAVDAQPNSGTAAP